MGTPTEETWKGVSQLKEYKSTFPQFINQDLIDFVNQKLIGPEGMDLLQRMLKMNPVERISAKSALSHVKLIILNFFLKKLQKNFNFFFLNSLTSMMLEAASGQEILFRESWVINK